MQPYKRKQYWNARRCRGGSAPTCSRSCAGSASPGGVFMKNMWRWITLRKGALTTYYPEETRCDYAANNRGKHVLTQRPDGTPQCIACNMCATVCPAKVIEIEAGFDPDDPAHPKYSGALRDRLLALHLLRTVRRGLPGRRDPDGQGSAQPAHVRPPRHVAGNGRAAARGTRRAMSPSPIRRKAARGRTRGTHDRNAAALSLRRDGAGCRGVDAGACGTRCASRSRSS